MVQVKPKLQTFDDFLIAAEGIEARCELTNGELIEVPPESDGNLVIAQFLNRVLSEIVGFRRVRTHAIALEMPGQPKNRFPDLTVLLPEHPEQLKAASASAIRLDMAPPLLAVEVVSPGADNHRRDYIEKRNQYEWRGIPEYWIVDPVRGCVIVLVLTDQGYEDTVFVEAELVQSPTFPNLNLPADAMLSPA